MNLTKKYLKAVASLAAGVMMLASCGLGEDNNQSMTKTVELTKQEIAVRNMTLNGSWEGKLYYVNNVKHENDSIDIVWKTDTVAKKVTISDFPVKLLAQYVDDESKELIANAADQSLVFDYYSVTSDYVEYYNMYYFRYQFTPVGNKAVFSANGEDITVTFMESLTDYSNVFSPMAVYYKRVMSGNILIGNISFKDKTYTANVLMSIGGTEIGNAN